MMNINNISKHRSHSHTIRSVSDINRTNDINTCDCIDTYYDYDEEGDEIVDKSHAINHFRYNYIFQYNDRYVLKEVDDYYHYFMISKFWRSVNKNMQKKIDMHSRHYNYNLKILRG